MVNYQNFLNNHIATVFSHPTNAAAIAAKGHRPLPVVSIPVTPQPTLRARLVAATGHIFTSNPEQAFDASRAKANNQ